LNSINANGIQFGFRGLFDVMAITSEHSVVGKENNQNGGGLMVALSTETPK
jgi:hypothetical protein